MEVRKVWRRWSGGQKPPGAEAAGAEAPGADAAACCPVGVATTSRLVSSGS